MVRISIFYPSRESPASTWTITSHPHATGLGLLDAAVKAVFGGHGGLRHLPVWSGGRREDSRRVATTSLSFSNALRTFYSFIYGLTPNPQREYDHGPYFVKRLIFNQEVAPIFGPYLFAPLTRLVRSIAERVSIIQSGYLNFYNALIGLLLILILALALSYKIGGQSTTRKTY